MSSRTASRLTGRKSGNAAGIRTAVDKASTMRRSAPKISASTEELTALVRQACLVAKDAAFNAGEYIAESSKMAFLAVKDCEKELDTIERQIDDSMSKAITEVTEAEARELLACLKFIIDLERIGDLTWTIAKRLQPFINRLQKDDSRDLVSMAKTVEAMLERIHQAFVERNVKPAGWVLQTDTRINQTCRLVFHRHLESGDPRQREYSTALLFVAQAFERAGDHATNLAEEVFQLVEGHSVRHQTKRRRLER
jgi:phosphate transport system protein